MRKFLSLVFVLCCVMSLQAQNKSIVEGVKVQTTFAEKLGTTPPIRDLIAKENISSTKKQLYKKNKAVPPNFKHRGRNSAIIPELEHQGEDPLWQKEIMKTRMLTNVPLVNVDGLSDGGPPQDPTGAIGKDHYLQAINATRIGVFDKEGNMETAFNGNTLWSSIGFSSAGDPIILYDHEIDRWVITEFPPSNNLLFAISETSDPLGSYNAYNFSTPQFPDYPKWGIWSNAYAVSTNEFGAGMIIYAINRDEMVQGEDMVSIQRLELPRPENTEQGFLVATPVDWNGSLAPPEGEGPYYLKLEDSSWGGVAKDEVQVYGLDVDWLDAANSTLSLTQIVTTPYDAFPCVEGGPGFACVPQMNGDALDGIPEVIMNTPKYRNFGTHESIVLNFITDVTDGDNYAGIRWMELRKTEDENWSLYQEGTFAPDDGKQRFMGGIGLAANGDIGLAYNFAGVDEFAGIAYSGRKNGDPLGQMTLEEVIVIEGSSTINSNGRFSDYSQLSIDPTNGKTFWFTTEYANSSQGTNTRIVAFELLRDSFDLALTTIQTPASQSDLTATEELEVLVSNVGLNVINEFTVGFVFDNGSEVVENVAVTIEPGNDYLHKFANTFDMTSISEYDFVSFVSLEADQNISNDTVRQKVSNIIALDIAVVDFLNLDVPFCDKSKTASVIIKNLGFNTITDVELVVGLNGEENQVIQWTGNLGYLCEELVEFILIDNIMPGENNLTVTARMPNGNMDLFESNNSAMDQYELSENLTKVTLELTLDFYPNETSWILSDMDGVQIASGDGYSDRNETIIEEFCLDSEQCYAFIISDSFGDGLTSNDGPDGSYTIYDENGVVLASIMEPNFGSVEFTEFCASFQCSVEATATVLSESEAGAADGVLMIEVTSGAGPFTYSIDGGTTFQADNTFMGLEAGDYDYVVLGAEDCTFEGSVTIDLCMLSASFEITSASSASEADGSITILAENAVGDVEYSIMDGLEFQNSNFFPGLLNGTYPVVIRDESGCEFRISVDVDVVSSSDDQTKLLGVQIFPNPTEGVFQVNVHGLDDADTFVPISIYDMKGKRVQNSKLVRYDQTHTGQLSLYAYPNGTYFFRIHHNSMKKLYRVIKQN